MWNGWLTMFKKLGKASRIPPGSGMSFRFGNKRIAVFNVDGQFFGTDDACPHRGAPLGEGPLTGSIVTCTWHGWEFDVCTGKNAVDDDLCVKTYPVQNRKGTLYVKLT